MLLNAIIAKLKKGSIKNVIAFGDTDIIPEMPYVVVKPEKGAIENTRQYRIIVHHNRGMFDELEAYAMKEIDQLLPSHIDFAGSRYKLYKGGYTDITAEPHDNTYFFERIFYVPLAGYNH